VEDKKMQKQEEGPGESFLPSELRLPNQAQDANNNSVCIICHHPLFKIFSGKAKGASI
jgi:hypothetical protein